MPMLGAVATMATLVVTKDCTALSDADLAEMSELCGGSGRAFEIGTLSKQAEAWVLVTLARDDAGALLGYSFCTLERIGGTPSVLIGLASVCATDDRAEVLDSIIRDQMRRAVLAFPDEDVLPAGRSVHVPRLHRLQRHHPPSGPQGIGRGAGVGSTPGQAVRDRDRCVQRPLLHRHR